MADITLCKPQRCKIKGSCVRYLTKPEEMGWYFKNEPCNAEGTKCEMYIEKKCKTCGQN